MPRLPILDHILRTTVIHHASPPPLPTQAPSGLKEGDLTNSNLWGIEMRNDFEVTLTGF